MQNLTPGSPCSLRGICTSRAAFQRESFRECRRSGAVLQCVKKCGRPLIESVSLKGSIFIGIFENLEKMSPKSMKLQGNKFKIVYKSAKNTKNPFSDTPSSSGYIDPCPALHTGGDRGVGGLRAGGGVAATRRD